MTHVKKYISHRYFSEYDEEYPLIYQGKTDDITAADTF